VIWHDSVGKSYEALVTAVWSQHCINLVFVSGDESRQDSCGRQIERQTSASHKDQQRVHGFYWRHPDEEPNPYVPPEQR
jgi:hypothetical protein